MGANPKPWQTGGAVLKGREGGYFSLYWSTAMGTMIVTMVDKVPLHYIMTLWAMVPSYLGRDGLHGLTIETM